MAKIGDLEVDTIHIAPHAITGYAESATSVPVSNVGGGPMVVSGFITAHPTHNAGGSCSWSVTRQRDGKVLFLRESELFPIAVVGGVITYPQATRTVQIADLDATTSETYNFNVANQNHLAVDAKAVIVLYRKGV